jgi:serine/threonine-protein kinase
MSEFTAAPGDVTGNFLSGEPAGFGQVPERIGDYRILREIGRGGMGIVFEAEQESLGRHVALKLLPSQALLDPRHLERFRREARAAARLHHSNIVPVFGVGEGEGLHYYVMQYITGSGLHEVIDELRLSKSPSFASFKAGASPAPTRSLHEVARSRLTRQSESGRAATTDVDASDRAPANDPSGGTAADIGGSGSSLSASSPRNFAREVARIGLQVAEALAYAHGQGVLHRDIKPANLLLDVQGTVWVADFGLAKDMGHGVDLTNEGDILGTLRYMAPERFRGQSDARGDLYALGLTLYELLTLRPAFDQNDRNRLILQVTTEVPPRPRTINPEIPRELETIVLKSIEQDPARRYPGARDLADDLKLFLDDRPIRARPVGLLERGQKWARRKPAIAGLLTALALAIAVGFVGITWQWREAVAARDDSRTNEKRARTNFDHALETVNTFCTEVSQEQLLDEPGMRPLRRRLLELALRYYQRFQREQRGGSGVDRNRGNDPKLMRELAHTYLNAGIIANELGNGSEGQREILRARDILEELCRGDPEDVESRIQLARCYIEFQNVERLRETITGNPRMMHPKAISQSIDLLEPMVAKDTDNLVYLRLLGRSYDMYGIQICLIGQYPKSRDALLKAIGILERVRSATPQDVEAVHWLALAYEDIALVLERTGRHFERVEALKKALAILETLEARYPRSRRHRLERARCLAGLGAARLELGLYRDAQSNMRGAEERLRVLSEEDPDAVDVWYWLAQAKEGQGRVALAQGRVEPACGLLRQAIAAHRQPLAKLPAERDLLGRAWSQIWLGFAEIEAGRPGEIQFLFDGIVEALESFQGQLLTGGALPHQSREIAQIAELKDVLLATARATTNADRIANQSREVEARRIWALKQPDNPALAFDEAWSLVQLTDLLALDGQVERARSSLARALPLLIDVSKSEPENLRWRLGLARAWEALAREHVRSGRSIEARDAAERAVEITQQLDGIDPTYSYDLACTLSLRGTISLSERDETRAFAAIQRAIKLGFFNKHMLASDPRLRALRSRPDFPVKL